jgi:putative addiction module component (TIGR02574 family)
MVIEKLPEVQALAPEEKWMLIDELWQDLAEQSRQSPVDAELVRKLEARFAEYLADPSKGSPAEEVFARLAQRKRA